MSDSDSWQVEFAEPDGRSRIRAAVTEVSRVNGAEVRLNVRIHAGSVFGDEFAATVHVWLFGPEVERFVAELRDLEQKRAGRAELASVSPDRFTLSFESIDRAGHVCVRASVSRRMLTLRQRYEESRVAMQMEIDPSRLPEYLAEFQRLGAMFAGTV